MNSTNVTNVPYAIPWIPAWILLALLTLTIYYIGITVGLGKVGAFVGAQLGSILEAI